MSWNEEERWREMWDLKEGKNPIQWEVMGSLRKGERGALW